MVVAEPGCTHEGRLETMLRLIEAAHQSGANAYKNQFISKPEEVRRRRKAVGQYPSYDWLNYPLEWHDACRVKCHALGMQYGCSTNLAEDLERVRPYVDFHKRPSFENNDHEWLSAAKQSGQRFMVSAGMLNHEGLVALIEAVDPWGEILHCTSSYPAPVESLNLAVISAYSLDGLSDHARHLRVGAYAACAGANIIEAHLKLNDTDPENPDAAVAFTPAQFYLYVEAIREAERMMGCGHKRIQRVEREMLKHKVA
jgi:N,N'-diacetyllegionaminate synthase